MLYNAHVLNVLLHTRNKARHVIHARTSMLASYCFQMSQKPVSKKKNYKKQA